MTTLAGIDIAAPPAVVLPLAVALLLVVAAMAARLASRLGRRWLSRSAPASASGGGVGVAGELALEPPHLGIPVGAAVLLGGLMLIAPEVSLPGRLGRWLGHALDISLVLACALAAARVAVAAVTLYAARNPSVTPALGVARVALRLLVGILAAIMALQTLGVPVAPLLTTLGVGSLAVALALQETLANFFAGLYLLADRPVRTGDYIKIHDGEEGYVEAIGWRSSRLRTRNNNIVIVPNQKLSQAILINFHLPSPPVSLVVPVTISYDSDSNAVEAALLEELQRADREVPEIGDARAHGGAPPVVRLVDLGESGLVFNCVVSVRDMEAQWPAAHELRKRILARLRHDGVEIPYALRMVRAAPHAERDRTPTSEPPARPR